jgi:hypothetical protein
MLKANKIPTTNRKLFLRSLIDNMGSRLLALTTLATEQSEIKLSCCNILELATQTAHTFTSGDIGIKEMAEQFGV